MAFRAGERYAYLCRHHPELKQEAVAELEMLKQEMTEHNRYKFWLGCYTPHAVPVGYVP